jgi:hypothetical protein
MNREGHNNIKFFFGKEVEHTPAYGMNTLFVVGLQSPNDIKEILDEQNSHSDSTQRIKHIYFGANMSFPIHIETNDAVFWNPWEKLIQYFLDLGYWCTLDIDQKNVEGLLESGLVEHHLFIPMISVKLPYIQQLGYNATIKLDDKDFAATNPGVWCHSLHELTRRETFTDWTQYKNDSTFK